MAKPKIVAAKLWWNGQNWCVSYSTQAEGQEPVPMTTAFSLEADDFHEPEEAVDEMLEKLESLDSSDWVFDVTNSQTPPSELPKEEQAS